MLGSHENKEVIAWWGREYPYDMATCGHCVSQHAAGLCGRKSHAKFRDAAVKLGLRGTEKLRVSPEEGRKLFLRLRKRFARFYRRKGGPTTTTTHEVN